MRAIVHSILVGVMASVAAAVQAQPPSPPPVEQVTRDATDANKPRVVPGFDASALDRGADPCQDFYRFACGGWLDRNPVPPDRGRYGRFDELLERNLATLRTILERAAAGGVSRDATDQRIGDYYASCMDEAAIEKRGIAPLRPQLDLIAGLRSKDDLATVLGRLHREGVDAGFDFGSQPDFKQSTMTIAAVDQGGLGLPDRDYYLEDEARFADVRARYPAHVKKMLQLLGDAPAAAEAGAGAVLEIETALARASLERVKRRDPVNRYHKMTRQELGRLTPWFHWDRYFTAVGAPAFVDVNVGWPDFFKGMGALIQSRSLDDWKAYLRWHALHHAAGLLPMAFVREDFAFFGKVLTGARELRPRWKRCVNRTDEDLGEALGRRYVEATFGEEGKRRTEAMVVALEKALGRDIRELQWMTEPTRQRALEKLGRITRKIGYPDRWRDYSGLRIVRGDPLGNALRAEVFENARDRSQIGKPVDPSEWRMTPPTVNAYYSSLENNINFPAGILQPPFFDRAMDDAVNLGGIGAVIGHELTHGFDDQGRKFDPQGNLADWWSPEDAREFEKRASCLADQYAQYTVPGGVHLNGRLTLGENTADNGGVRIAYMALQDMLAGGRPPLRDGFTPEQRLFLAWGQIWCQNQTDETARLRAQTDPHSPGRYRVVGVVSNMPEFQKAFACPAGSPMVRENACRVW